MAFWQTPAEYDAEKTEREERKEEIKVVENTSKDSIETMLKKGTSIKTIEEQYPKIKWSWGGNPAKICGYRTDNKWHAIKEIKK